MIAGLNLIPVFKSGKIKCTLFLTFPASTLPDFLRREVFICFESHSASHLVPRSIAFKLRCYSSDSCRNKCVPDELSRPTRTTWPACYLAFSLSLLLLPSPPLFPRALLSMFRISYCDAKRPDLTYVKVNLNISSLQS